MNVEEIYQDILSLPEPIQGQVRDFVDFLKSKYASTDSAADRFFWGLIKTIDLDSSLQPEVLDQLINALAACTVEEIYTFQDTLAHKLSILDGPDYWEVGGGSADGFLYKRCYVVAKGEAYFQKVLANPKDFPQEPWLELEALLFTPDKAYELKTGKELERIPTVNYETRFNADNWGAEAIQL